MTGCVAATCSARPVLTPQQLPRTRAHKMKARAHKLCYPPGRRPAAGARGGHGGCARGCGHARCARRCTMVRAAGPPATGTLAGVLGATCCCCQIVRHKEPEQGKKRRACGVRQAARVSGVPCARPWRRPLSRGARCWGVMRAIMRPGRPRRALKNCIIRKESPKGSVLGALPRVLCTKMEE